MVARRGQVLWFPGGMSDAMTRPDWLTPEVLDHLHQVAFDFHVRAFGEEMARVNLLPLAERRRYVADMFDHAMGKGVKFDKPALGVTL
jgi:hypothetical protein